MQLDINEIKQFKQMCSNISILMVDDEVMLTKYYEEIASRFFDKVDIANSGQEALDMYEVNKYDVIYTDINMPLISGIDLIRKIKDINDKQKFIVISASNDNDKIMELLTLNISGFIVKPLTLDSFVNISQEQISIVLQMRSMEEQAKNLTTTLKKVEEENKEKEKMLIEQSKLAQTGEMISMISHQWRQPLSSITTTIAGLKVRLELGTYEASENPVQKMTEDFTKAFVKMEESAIFLSNTIDDFRNFYRPDNDKSSFNICKTMETVLSMIDMKDYTVELEFSFLKSNQVFTFEGELKQVFICIINNAIDAIKEKHIEKPKILITMSDNEKDTLVSISDNAGGVPSDIIENIFLPYFSTKTQKNGTGLGLHMANTIVKEHVGGTLSVKNIESPNGAKFTITIPKIDTQG
ncbi:MAG: response regulator [Sulfurimonas sp.]|nr:response regulator [Sulfurimonas sp.]